MLALAENAIQTRFTKSTRRVKSGCCQNKPATLIYLEGKKKIQRNLIFWTAKKHTHNLIIPILNFYLTNYIGNMRAALKCTEACGHKEISRWSLHQECSAPREKQNAVAFSYDHLLPVHQQWRPLVIWTNFDLLLTQKPMVPCFVFSLQSDLFLEMDKCDCTTFIVL